MVETVPRTLVIGGGIAGLRAAVGLADIGLGVVIVEREVSLGGWVRRFGAIYPHDRDGHELIAGLVQAIKSRPTITVLTSAEVVGKSGSFGDYQVEIRVGGEGAGTIRERVGSIIVATGFDSYQPDVGEFGYGIDGVLTLPQFKELVDGSTGGLRWHDRPVRGVAYVYCVGSRQPGGNEYCSRFCCAATCHTAVSVAGLDPAIRQYHLYRDIRTYGKFETLYTEARKTGSVFLKFPEETPPAVAERPGGGLEVTVTDLLTERQELALPVDLVVLVTGMVPRANEELVGALKLPLGKDGFFNEIHPKLRPVETVVDGVLIAGACQGPKTSAESVASGLAAVTQSAAILRKGFAELDPLVAEVHRRRLHGLRHLPHGLPVRRDLHVGGRRSSGGRHQRDRLQVLRRLRPDVSRERHRPARLHRCPGHRDDRQPAGGGGRMNGPNAPDREIREIVREEPVMRARILDLLEDGPRTVPEIADAIGAPTHEVVFWVMGMRRYGWLIEVKATPVDGYFQYERTGRTVMTAQVDVGLYADLKRFGAADVSACFSCGTCTAICPLSDGDAMFPRRIIRYAQVGLKDQLLSSKELWSCYQCAECSDSCPTGAGPSEFMAATRRYAIASYDRTRLARTMYLHPVVGTLLAIGLAVFFALFMYVSHGPQERSVPGHLRVHPGATHPRHRRRGDDHRVRGRTGRRGHHGSADRGDARVSAGAACSAAALRCGTLWRPAGRRSRWSRLGQRRYRADCASDAGTVAWYRRRWFIHAATMWGFLGLFAATILDYGLDVVGIKKTGEPVPIWYPVRLLGTVAGVLLVYGVTMMIIDRARHASTSVARSTNADWTLLTLLWITGVTGFGLELALYLPRAAGMGLLGVPVPRRGGHGARTARPVHEAGARGLSAGRAVLRGPRTVAPGECARSLPMAVDTPAPSPTYSSKTSRRPEMTMTLPTQTHEHHERLLAHVDRMPALGRSRWELRDRNGAHAAGRVRPVPDGDAHPARGRRREDAVPGARASPAECPLDDPDAPRAWSDPPPGRRPGQPLRQVRRWHPGHPRHGGTTAIRVRPVRAPQGPPCGRGALHAHRGARHIRGCFQCPGRGDGSSHSRICLSLGDHRPHR